ATQDPELRKRFAGEPDHVVRFFTFLAESLRHELARLGLRSLDELVGRWDLVRVREGAETPKGVSLDLRPLVDPGALPPGSATRWQGRRNDPPPPAAPTLDDELAAAVAAWLERGAEGVLEFDAEVDNGQRTLGARAAGLVARRYGDAGPRDGSLVATFTGAAGQSFGSFALPGMRLVLRGEAQDYVG